MYAHAYAPAWTYMQRGERERGRELHVSVHGGLHLSSVVAVTTNHGAIRRVQAVLLPIRSPTPQNLRTKPGALKPDCFVTSCFGIP